MSKDRDTLKTSVLLAERAERHNDMFNKMLELMKLDEGLSEDERSLLSLASKNLVSPKRSSCRCLVALEDKYSHDEFKLACIRELKDAVITEIADVCKTLVETINNHVLNRQNNPTDIVFFLKMCGDYYRYHAEALKGDARAQVAKEAHEFYMKAYNIAMTELKPTNTVRLGLGLNLSVFYYEVEENTQLAKKTAREFLDVAVDKAGDESEGLKDYALIIQLLRDNLSLWNSETSVSPQPEEEAEGSTESGIKAEEK